MSKRLLHLILIIFLNTILELPAQEVYTPKIWLEVAKDSMTTVLFDKQDVAKRESITQTEEPFTNFHISLNMDDTSVYFVYDSLRYDSIATIMTIYETDDDTTVGVWEIGTGDNKQLWLNSRKVSYQDFGITYRRMTEKGVIINTMQFEYPKPDTDTVYTGRDTLFIGKQGENIGDKNFCEFLYFKGVLPYNDKRINETCLAIKYGALLHNEYLDRNLDTIWDSKGTDSLYSYGVCGIGRDDYFPLFQDKSRIRKDLLTIEMTDSLSNMNYIMLGHNEYDNQVLEESFSIDTNEYHFISRKWKVRSNTNGRNKYIRLIYNTPSTFNRNSVRMFIGTQDSSYYTANIIRPTFVTDSCVVFDSILIIDSIDYYINIALEGDSIFNLIETKSDLVFQEEDKSDKDTDNNIRIMVTPNPTNTGEFEINVDQIKEDYISIFITDSKGQIVYSNRSNDKVKEYSLLHHIQKQGIYFVTIHTNDVKRTIKLVVVK